MATDGRLLLDKTWFDDGRLFASWHTPARRSPGAIVAGVLAWRYGTVSNANRGDRRRSR